MKVLTVPLDYFGVAATSVMQRLMAQDSNKRARKVARNELLRIATACKLLPPATQVKEVGITVDEAGQIQITFIYDERAETGRVVLPPTLSPLETLSPATLEGFLEGEGK